MSRTDLVAVYAAGVGVLLLVWWGLAMARGDLPDRATRPQELVTHLAAEVITAICLIAAGIALAYDAEAPEIRTLAAVALGALLYTLLQTPGELLARGQQRIAAAYVVLALLDLAAIAALL